MMKWKKTSEYHQYMGGKENTGHAITDGGTKGKMRIRPGIFAASAAVCLVVSSLTAGCGFGKSAAVTPPASADEKTEQMQTGQQTQAPQEEEKSTGAGIKYPDNCILYFKNDSGLAKLKADMEAGEIPVDCKALYDESGSRPVVTVTDPEKVREIYDRLTRVTVGEKSSQSITDCYHHVTFHLRDDSFVAVRFEGEYLLCWGQDNYEAQGASSLWAYIRSLQDEAMEKAARKDSSDSGQGSSSGKKGTNTASGIQTKGYSEDVGGKTTVNVEKEEDTEKDQPPQDVSSAQKDQPPQESSETQNDQSPQKSSETQKDQPPQESSETQNDQPPQESSETQKDQPPQESSETQKDQPPQNSSETPGDRSTQEAAVEEADPLELAYSEILKAYSALLGQDADRFIEDYENGKFGGDSSTGADPSVSVNKNINYRLLYEHFRNAENNKVSYGYRDYNGDGVQELVIALGNEEYSRVWTVYTFDGKNAVELFRDHYGLDYRVTLSVLEDKTFLIRASGGASAGRVTVCRINKALTGLEMIAEYEYDEQKNGSSDYISTGAAEGSQSSQDGGNENTEEKLPQRMTQDEFNERYSKKASSAEEGISFKVLNAEAE